MRRTVVAFVAGRHGRSHHRRACRPAGDTTPRISAGAPFPVPSRRSERPGQSPGYGSRFRPDALALSARARRSRSAIPASRFESSLRADRAEPTIPVCRSLSSSTTSGPAPPHPEPERPKQQLDPFQATRETISLLGQCSMKIPGRTSAQVDSAIAFQGVSFFWEVQAIFLPSLSLPGFTRSASKNDRRKIQRKKIFMLYTERKSCFIENA